MNLAEVYNDTVRYFGNAKSNSSVKYSEPIELTDVHYHDSDSNCVIEVSNSDTFDMAIRYLDEGLKPVVLNMASDKSPGGGVKKGARAQEEDLFRRSNAYQTHRRSFYPLSPKELIYSPQVTIIKDSKYEIIPEKVVSMIACAAIRKPTLVNERYSQEDYQLMQYKVDSIFRAAILWGHDSIVLGALGCGAFSNPPRIVASIFKQAVERYKQFFRKIGFAILVVNDRDYDNLHEFTRAFM